MAHQGRPVRGAEVGESVNRGGRDLHSSHQNTENQNESRRSRSEIKLPEYQKTAYGIMARWIGPLHQEKAWTEFRSMVQVVEELGAERGRAEERDRRAPETSQQSAIPHLEQIIEGAVAKALSKTPTTASSWACRRSAWRHRRDRSSSACHPFSHPLACSSRNCHQRIDYPQAVNERQPENIVLAVNAAIKRDVAVAAQHSGNLPRCSSTTH
ncbi:hypothetical protein E4U25_006836 [Claviceps purpurea]|nr:hypothetical protein E4U25_006836 [Claviceps purpurea]